MRGVSTRKDRGVVEFLLEPCARLGCREAMREVRAGSGFFAQETVPQLEDQELPTIPADRLAPWSKFTRGQVPLKSAGRAGIGGWRGSCR